MRLQMQFTLLLEQNHAAMHGHFPHYRIHQHGDNFLFIQRGIQFFADFKQSLEFLDLFVQLSVDSLQFPKHQGILQSRCSDIGE